MTGMTPAMLTRSGRYVEPPDIMRRPTWRLAYWIGMRRWPSFMNTTARITPSVTTGSASRSNVPPLSQASIAGGAAVRIEAKISSEMPLPTPRWVISSPIHISSVVPAVSVITIRMKRPTVRSGSRFVAPIAAPFLNRNT